MPRPGSDLVDRTYAFAKNVRGFANALPKTISNFVDVRQLIRSSGSVAANYLESQEGLSRKDFFFRIKICRKEARESGLWLRLLDPGLDRALVNRREELVSEAEQLKRIFAAIVRKDDTSAD